MRTSPLDPVRFPENFRPRQRCTVYDADGRPIATIDPYKRKRVELKDGTETTLARPQWDGQDPGKLQINMLHHKPGKGEYVPRPEPLKKPARSHKGRDWYA